MTHLNNNEITTTTMSTMSCELFANGCWCCCCCLFVAIARVAICMSMHQKFSSTPPLNVLTNMRPYSFHEYGQTKQQQKNYKTLENQIGTNKRTLSIFSMAFFNFCVYFCCSQFFLLLVLLLFCYLDLLINVYLI